MDIRRVLLLILAIVASISMGACQNSGSAAAPSSSLDNSPSPTYTPSPVYTPYPTSSYTPAPSTAVPSTAPPTTAPLTSAPATTAPAPTAAPEKSALNVIIRLVGPGIWPFGTGRQAALVSALASSLSSVVSAADISVTSVTQPASFRRSLLWEAEPLDGSWEPERRKVTGGSLFGSSRPVDFSPCADADEKAALFGVRKFQVQAAHNLNLQGHQVPMDIVARARRQPNTIEDAAPAALWQPLLPAAESLHRTVQRHLLQTESVSAADVAMQFDAGSNENVQTVQNALQAALSQSALKVALLAQGINATSITLQSSDAAVPSSTQNCAQGSVSGACIGSAHRGVPVAVVAVIAVVCAVLLAAAITLSVSYCCWRKHRGKQEGFLEMSDGKAAFANQKPAEMNSQAAFRAQPLKPATDSPLNPSSPPSSSVQAIAGGSIASSAGPQEQDSVTQPLRRAAPVGTPAEVTQPPADMLRSSSEHRSVTRAAAAQPDITASRAGPAGAVFLTPHLPAGSDVQSRIAAANASIQAFQDQLNATSAQVSIERLLARHQAAAHPLLNPQARGSRASHAMEAAMHYITSSSLFAGKYVMEGGKVVGDCAVTVNGRRQPWERHGEVLLKFFMLPADFKHERALFSGFVHSSFVPGVCDIFEAGDVESEVDGGNPACIVMQRGSLSLADWLSKMESSPSALGRKDMLFQLAEGLNYLHARNIVHRSVEPAHIQFFEKQKRWLLADFSKWARRGTESPVVFSLRHAAPELITAAAWGAMTRAQGSAGPTYLISDPAVDMWALGAVAWEAFTGKPLFGDQFSDADVMAMLLGQQQLPFERDPSLFVLFSDPQAANLVRNLLVRRPEQRWPIVKVLQAIASLSADD